MQAATYLHPVGVTFDEAASCKLQNVLVTDPGHKWAESCLRTPDASTRGQFLPCVSSEKADMTALVTYRQRGEAWQDAEDCGDAQ